MNIIQYASNYINSQNLDGIRTLGAIQKLAGAGITIWGVTDLCRASCQNDRNQRNALLHNGARKVAFGVVTFACGMGLSTLESAQNIKEVALDPSEGLKVTPDTARLLMGKHFDPETQGIKVDPTVCNLEALNSIVEKKLPHANKALFRSFTCEDFLPWNHEKFSEEYSKTTGIDPKDLSKSIMWGLGPYNEPFIAMTDANKEEFFSMRFSINPYASKLITSCKGMYDRYGPKRVGYISSQLGDGLHLLDKEYIKRATEANCPKIADVFFSFLDEKVHSVINSMTTLVSSNMTLSI